MNDYKRPTSKMSSISTLPRQPKLLKPSVMQALGLDPISDYPCFDLDGSPQPRRVRRNAKDKRKSKRTKEARRKNRNK